MKPYASDAGSVRKLPGGAPFPAFLITWIPVTPATRLLRPLS
jgi:hypothetical protein